MIVRQAGDGEFRFRPARGRQRIGQADPPRLRRKIAAQRIGFIADAEGGDARLSKAFKRADKPTQAGLEGEYGFNVYASNTSSIAIIRNEELILLWAEANAQKSNVAEAVSALNVIRKANGLRDFTTSSKDEAITEMLKQRRYSLYGEGHRWVDMRRYGRLGELPKDRADDDVWEKFPRPTNE